MEDLPSVPIGGYRSVGALRGLRDQVKSLAIFWGIRRS
jgi:hypothetical protein